MPLVTPFRTSYDDTFFIESVFVRLESEGIAGWGEVTPWETPLYSAEWAAGVFDLARRWCAPRLLGQEVDSTWHLQRLLSPVRGNPFARAAFDVALWDWQARKQDVPLWQLLGGSDGVVAVGADFGVVDGVPELLRLIGSAFDAGFGRVKLKVKPGWDVEVIREVRKAFPKGVFHVDANCSYTLDDIAILRQLDEFNLAMIEQPLGYGDLLDHAKLASRMKTPICLDESIASLKNAQQALEIGACGIINIKPGRVGGVSTALDILKHARERKVPCWIGSMLESAVGSSFCLALATLPGMGYPPDIFPSSRFYERDLANREYSLCGPGQIRAFEGPGIGCEPSPDQLEGMTIDSFSLRA